MMDANKLKEILDKHLKWLRNEEGGSGADLSGANLSGAKIELDLLNKFFPIACPPRWIPVSERLPEETGTYLVWMKWDLTEADEEPSAYPVLYDADAEGFGWWKSYYSGETLGWAGEDFVRYEGITHWMPLPEPPEEET